MKETRVDKYASYRDEIEKLNEEEIVQESKNGVAC